MEEEKTGGRIEEDRLEALKRKPLEMSRVEKAQPSHLDIHQLSSPESRKAVDVLLNLLSTCSGPSGKIHVVRNSCGGHMTFSSDCARLLAVILISRPELKLIVTSVQAHLNQHHDCGLYMACMCLHLIKSSLELGTPLHVHSSLCELFGQIINDYLNSLECMISLKADFTNLKVLLAYVGSILKSKTFLNLSKSDCNSFSQIVIKAFLESIPTQHLSSDIRYSDGIHLISLEGRSIVDSRVENGLLLDYPELLIIKGVVKLKPKTVPRGEKNKECSDLEADSYVKVALFTCSMSGDVEEIIDATFEVTKQQSEDVEKMVLTKMTKVCEKLANWDVGLVLCQRVIHPQIKSILRSKGILFLDRLGSQVIPYLQDLTGAKPIASVIVPADLNDHLGMTETVTHVIEGDKSYMHLTNLQAPVVTILLCATMEEKLTELKRCVQQALHGLRSLSSAPKLLAGGGCWQTHCSHFLKNKVLSQLPALAVRVGCTEAQVVSSLASFRSSLHNWVRNLADNTEEVLVDSTVHHCWRVPKGEWTDTSLYETLSCCCGMNSVSAKCVKDFDLISRQENTIIPQKCDADKISVTENPIHSDLILDSFSAASQALYKGVFTANLALSVGHFICDKN